MTGVIFRVRSPPFHAEIRAFRLKRARPDRWAEKGELRTEFWCLLLLETAENDQYARAVRAKAVLNARQPLPREHSASKLLTLQ
jgi:hypothetical protein